SNFSESAGSIRGLLNMGLVAADIEGTTATGEQLLKGAAKATPVGKLRGLSFNEVLAGTTLLATSAGSGDEGGTQLAAFLQSITEQEDFNKLGLVESVDKLSQKNLKFDELTKLLGRKEAVQGFLTLRENREKLVDAIGLIADSGDTDMIAGAIANSELDPAMRATRAARIAANRRDLAEEGMGIKQNLRAAARDTMSRRLRESG